MQPPRSGLAAAGIGTRRRVIWAATVALIALGATSCGSGTSHGAAPTTGTPGAGPTVAQSTTAPVSAPAGPPTLPVVSCPSSYGGPPGLIGPHLPATITVQLPILTAEQLSFYSNDTRTLTPILGPRGWDCQVQVGADGTAGVDVHPVGTASGPATGAGSNGQPGINAASDSACQGCVFSTVCAFVPNAAAQLGYTGLPCPPLASGTKVNFIKGSPTSPGPQVDDVIVFAAATAPTPTNGVVLYRHQAGGGGASQETCNLPAGQSRLCTTILNDFIRTAWLMPRLAAQ